MKITGRILSQDVGERIIAIEYSYLDCEDSETVEFLIDSQKRILIQAKVTKQGSHEDILRKKFFSCIDEVLHARNSYSAKNKKRFYESVRREFFPLRFLELEGNDLIKSDPYFPSIMELSQEELGFVLENFIEKWERLGIVFKFVG